MLFDLEIAFIFPWSVYFHFFSLVGLFNMFFFLIVLFECFILSNFTYCFKLFVFLLHFYSVARMHLMLCAFCLFTCCFCCSIVWPDVQLSLVFKELVPLTFSVPTHAADLPMIAIPRPPSSSFQGLESLELCCSGHQDHD